MKSKTHSGDSISLLMHKRCISSKKLSTILQKCPPVKFDQSVDVALKTGIDPEKSDQQVRGVVSLPNGTGKNSDCRFRKGRQSQRSPRGRS